MILQLQWKYASVCMKTWHFGKPNIWGKKLKAVFEKHLLLLIWNQDEEAKKKLRSTYLSWLKAAVLFWKKTKKSANSERVTTTFFSFKAWKFSKKQTDIWSKFECQNWLRCDWIWGHSAVRCSCHVCIRLIDQLLHKIFDCGFLLW